MNKVEEYEALTKQIKTKESIIQTMEANKFSQKMVNLQKEKLEILLYKRNNLKCY